MDTAVQLYEIADYYEACLVAGSRRGRAYCVQRACSVRMQYACSARAVRVQCACSARAVRVQCACSACAVRDLPAYLVVRALQREQPPARDGDARACRWEEAGHPHEGSQAGCVVRTSWSF